MTHPIDTPKKLAEFIGDQLSEDFEAWEIDPSSPDLLIVDKDGARFEIRIRKLAEVSG